MADGIERDEGQRHEILISDKRHSREIEASTEEPEAAAPERVEAPPAAAESPEREAPTLSNQTKPPVDSQPQQPPPETGAGRPPLDDSPETAHLRMLFEAGMPTYLHSQLQLILNFAMIYLGRQPNPATGLVSTDLENARLAIDLFEFIVKRTHADLPEQDRAGLANLVGSLKMEYAQVAQSATTPPPSRDS